MPKSTTPIMPSEQERFMAFTGAQQWALAVVDHRNNLRRILAELLSPEMRKARQGNLPNHVICKYRMQSAATDFCNSIILLKDFIDWAKSFGDFGSCIPKSFEALEWGEIKDVRNMRVHIGEYFQGRGNAQKRWFDFRENTGADASSMMNTRIGNRVDYEEIGGIVEKMLESMLAEPVPFPSP